MKKIEKITITVDYNDAFCGNSEFIDTPKFNGFELVSKDENNCPSCDNPHQMIYTYKPIERYSFMDITLNDDDVENILITKLNCKHGYIYTFNYKGEEFTQIITGMYLEADKNRDSHLLGAAYSMAIIRVNDKYNVAVIQDDITFVKRERLTK